jgi:uncharacterized membrane protein
VVVVLFDPAGGKSLVLTRDKHHMLLRRVAVIVSIAVILVLLAYVFQTCGSPIDPLNNP